MSKLNQILLIGNVANTIDSHTTSKGKLVVKFPLAVDRPWPDNRHDSLREVDYHQIVCWGKLGEISQKIVNKGDKILVQGTLLNHSYKDKNDKVKYLSEIHANDLSVLHWKDNKKTNAKIKKDKVKTPA